MIRHQAVSAYCDKLLTSNNFIQGYPLDGFEYDGIFIIRNVKHFMKAPIIILFHKNTPSLNSAIVNVIILPF